MKHLCIFAELWSIIYAGTLSITYFKSKSSSSRSPISIAFNRVTNQSEITSSDLLNVGLLFPEMLYDSREKYLFETHNETQHKGGCVCIIQIFSIDDIFLPLYF